MHAIDGVSSTVLVCFGLIAEEDVLGRLWAIASAGHGSSRVELDALTFSDRRSWNHQPMKQSTSE